MITAKEAIELSGPDAEYYLSELDKKIRKAAENKGKEVLIRADPYARWLYDEEKLSPAEKQAVKTLRDNGFKLSLYYKELQFVDMGLIIKWGNDQ